MSAFKQKLARIGATAGVLAATTAAIMAVGGVSASIASAACPSAAESLSIQGKGSSLQRVGQEFWTGRKVPSGEPLTGLPHEALAGPVGYAASCPEAPVSYTSTSSGNGLTAFSFNGGGAIKTEIAFIGTDDGPQRTQIEAAETATSNKSRPVIIPVAETAIAVVVHPPTSCAFAKNKGITWAQLNKIFNGTISNWAGLKPQVTGTGCTAAAAITRVVRAEGSGTTTQFKNYLSTLETEHAAEGPGCSLGKWGELKNIGEKEEPNIIWPECTTKVTRKAGGGAVAEFVASEAGSGSIGYAALPDAKGKGATPALLQDEESAEEPLFGSPEGASETSNCGTRQYTVPAKEEGGAKETGGREGEEGVAVNWFNVYGANSTVGGKLYPLCTLTYDAGWSSYKEAGYGTTEGPKVAKNVKSYLEFVLTMSAPGTLTPLAHWYQALPSPAEKAHNVYAAAQLAVSKIG